MNLDPFVMLLTGYLCLWILCMTVFVLMFLFLFAIFLCVEVFVSLVF